MPVKFSLSHENPKSIISQPTDIECIETKVPCCTLLHCIALSCVAYHPHGQSIVVVNLLIILATACMQGLNYYGTDRRPYISPLYGVKTSLCIAV